MYIDKENLAATFDESKTHMNNYFAPLGEFERIARNKPQDNIPKGLPRVTDGTLAAIVQEQPKRIIQQIPTGTVTVESLPGITPIANAELNNKLIPLGTTMGHPLQKSWNMVGKALTYGVQASYTFFTETNGVFHTDFIIPYIKDIYLEKGKVFGPDCNVLFMRSWYNERDLKGIIKQEKRFKKELKNHKPEWDVKALQELINSGPGGQAKENQTPAEREKGEHTGSYEIIHAFQEGDKAEFYSFAPQHGNKIVRTKVNKDLRGKMPINFLYHNVDLSNPLGRGAVEMSGGVQNLMDNQMQMFQFTNTLEMGPPLQKWGTVDSSTLKIKPNVIWDMGTGPNNRVEPYRVSNNAINNFPVNYGLLKSQILNLNSTMDTSISAEAGNPGFSKTPAGVKQGEARVSVSDNYMRKQYEAWWSDQCETALNIYYGEMEGKDTVPITPEMRKKLPKDLIEKYTNKEGQLELKYDDIKDVAFTFQVDASSSEVKETAENIEKAVQILELTKEEPDPWVQQGRKRLLNRIIQDIGLEDAEDIFPTDEDGNPEVPEGMEQPEQPGQPGQPGPEDDQLTPEEQEFAQGLLQAGFPGEQVQQAILMHRQGVPAQEIVRAIQGAANGQSISQ